jgi:hypothetical protein
MGWRKAFALTWPVARTLADRHPGWTFHDRAFAGQPDSAALIATTGQEGAPLVGRVAGPRVEQVEQIEAGLSIARIQQKLHLVGIGGIRGSLEEELVEDRAQGLVRGNGNACARKIGRPG